MAESLQIILRETEGPHRHCWFKPYDVYPFGGYQCMECENWIPYEKDHGYWNNRECFCSPCAMNLERRKSFHLDVPAHFMSANLDALPPKVKAKAKKWPEPIRNFGIQGLPGSGKTYACWAIAKWVSKVRQIPIVYTYGADARAAWLEAINSKGGERILYRWINAPFLIFDDVTSANPTDGWKEAFFRILNERGMNDRPTLVTSMDKGEVVAAQYGKAVYSRLSGYEWSHMPAQDRRKKVS